MHGVYQNQLNEDLLTTIFFMLSLISLSLIFLAILWGITIPLLQIRKLRSREVKRLVFLNAHKEKRVDLSYQKLKLMAVWQQVQSCGHSAALLGSSFWGPEFYHWCCQLTTVMSLFGKIHPACPKSLARWPNFKKIQKKKTLPKKSDIFLASGIIRKQKEVFLYILKLSLKMRYCHLM